MANLREGSRRIKVVGQLTALVAVALAVCVVTLQLLMPWFVYLLAAVVMFVRPTLAGLTLWALGWVMEGFATTK